MSEQEAESISGRFQPLTYAGEAAIRKSLDRVGEATVIVTGMDRPRSVNDPFTFEDRQAMLAAAFPDEFADGRLRVVGLPDYGYDTGLRARALAAFGPSVAVENPDDPPHRRAEALDSLFKSPSQADVSRAVASWLSEFSSTAPRQALEDELDVIFEVRRRYGPGPHLTADSICTWNGQVLLIERGNAPFRNTLAIPGGIVDNGEDPFDAAARELSEETRISIGDAPMDARTIKSFSVTPEARVYGEEGRDPRGTYIGHAFHFDFSSLPERPRVEPADDAKQAIWHDLSSLKPHELAFDHFAILHDLTGLQYPKSSVPEEHDGPQQRRRA